MTTLGHMARRQVDQFLSALFLPEELIELRFIESWLSHGKKRSRVVRAAQWLHRADVIATHADLTAFARRTRANIYFGVNPRPKRAMPTTRPSRRSLRVVRHRQRWPGRSAKPMDGCGHPQPSIVVSSGSGIHGYWLLEQDLHSPEDHSRLEPCFRASMRVSAAITCRTCPHHAPPGNVHYKEARTVGRSDLHALRVRSGRAVSAGGVFPWFEQEREGRREGYEHAVCDEGWSLTCEAQSRNADIAELIGRLQIPSRDRSRRDFAVICDLLRLGLAKENIWQLVAGSSKFESAGRPYFDLTITNAERRLCLDGPAHAEYGYPPDWFRSHPEAEWLSDAIGLESNDSYTHRREKHSRDAPIRAA